ncbi:MAG: DUF2505 domain-containing protein [Arachnia sp.]
MDLRYEHAYQGTPDAVAALMGNPEFIGDIAEHAGATSHTVDVSDEVTTLSMAVPAPTDIAKVIGATVQIEQIFRWEPSDGSGTRRGTVDVRVKGVPVAAKAVAELVPAADGGAAGTYVGELTVNIPLVGKRIETQAAPIVRSAFAGIERRANAWLS